MVQTYVRSRIAWKIVCVVLAWTTPILSLSQAFGGEWADEFSAGNFVFRSEFPLKDVQDLLNEIADLHTDLEDTLGVTCSDREIQVHLFRGRMTYHRYLSVRVPQGARRQAFYMPSPDVGRVYAYRHRGLEIDVRHETTHALLRNALPFVPLWLDEGLAEYFEVPAAQRQQGDGHLGELRLAMRLGWKPDLKRLEAKRGFLEMGPREYRDSWGIIHYLLHGPPEAKQVFLDYVHEIESGGVPGHLSEKLETSIPDYEQQIVRHLKGS